MRSSWRSCADLRSFSAASVRRKMASSSVTRSDEARQIAGAEARAFEHVGDAEQRRYRRCPHDVMAGQPILQRAQDRGLAREKGAVIVTVFQIEGVEAVVQRGMLFGRRPPQVVANGSRCTGRYRRVGPKMDWENRRWRTQRPVPVRVPALCRRADS